jgi:hypothetical protein
MLPTDISPLFLTNVKYKVFCYSGHDVLEVVKLECINPTPQLVRGETYWGYKDTSSNYWYYNTDGYDCYRIFLPILGCRKYDPKRFKVISECKLYKKDFNYYTKLQ